ncbi:39S ribosomal protein L33, mitochondrial isoform X1 [Heterodontus francisci]|uniref:39S ribosomal protein L33, mitochondrial isoform X1 n=1 Tax=Heterodontus francisci TaxID=7792 RepID=UPI00355C19FD
MLENTSSLKVVLGCHPEVFLLVSSQRQDAANDSELSILVRMVSAAGSGYCFNAKRSRLREKLVLRKHDPKVNKHVLFFEKKKIRSI